MPAAHPPPPRPTLGPSWLLTGFLAFVVLGLFVAAHVRMTRERRAFVERRLAAAAEVLTEPAQDVLVRGGSKDAFLERLRELASTSGLRITLIGLDGEALADSVVQGGMPNLGDRPEVVGAAVRGAAAAMRTSATTGEETIYVARAVESDGKRLGTIRAATRSSEIGGAFAGVEALFAAAGLAGVATGIVVGLRFGRSRAAERSEAEVRVGDRRAAA